MKKEQKDLTLFNKAKAIEAQINALQSELSATKAAIIQRMVDNQLVVNGAKLAWLTDVPGSIGVDASRLKVEHPEIFEEFKKEGKPSQRLYLKK
jgi:hypothetical protein